MIESVAIGVGAKLLTNVVNSWFHHSEKKAERKYLKDQELVEKHVELQKLTLSNPIANITRSITSLMIFGSFCYIGIYAMHNPGETDILIPLKQGFFSRLWTQPESIVKAGRTPGVLFQTWYEVVICFASMYALPSRRR